MSHRLRIALSGKARSGKDTAALILKESYGARLFSFSRPLYKVTEFIQTTLHKEVVKDPNLLQLIGGSLRDLYGSDVWVEELLRDLKTFGDTNDPLVVVDVRHKNEYDALKREGFIIIRINRENRPRDRDPTHPSETELDGASFDYLIENNGSIEELKQSLEKVIGI